MALIQTWCLVEWKQHKILSYFENGIYVTAYFMLHRTEMHALLPVRKKKYLQVATEKCGWKTGTNVEIPLWCQV